MAADPGTVTHRAHAALDRLADPLSKSDLKLGVALSGGGDSTALLHLAHRWGRARLWAATVDHGLRPGSGDEARQAGQVAARLGVPHETLPWQRTGGGNLMAAARDARLRLLSDWARRHELDGVLLGHTLDDQAETLLMRLSRGAGVDGLSGMAGQRQAEGALWLRPMLAISRVELRDWLRAQGIGWIDDPSNQREDFQRIRIRKAMTGLDLPLPQLAQSLENLEMARDALAHYAVQTAQGAQSRAGGLDLPLAAFLAAPDEIRRRLFVAGLRFVGGAGYPPRRAPVRHALDELAQGRQITLDGVIARPRAGWLHLLREPAASLRAAPACGDPALWDGRWRVTGLQPGQDVRALGHDPLPALNWRASGLARDAAAATPGIWQGRDLRAAPLLQPAPQITATPLRGLPDFHAMLYVH